MPPCTYMCLYVLSEHAKLHVTIVVHFICVCMCLCVNQVEPCIRSNLIFTLAFDSE